MASAVRLPTMRHALRQPLLNPRFCQRRWAQVHDVRFLATHHSDDRILAKYKEKLARKAQEAGLKDVSELKEAYKEKIDKLRKDAVVPGATGPLTPPSPPSSTTSTSTSTSTSSPPSSQSTPPTSSSSSSPWPSPPPPPTPQPTSEPPPGVKTLHSFLDLTKVTTLPSQEIEALWRMRHSPNPQSIHFSLPAPTFHTLLRAAKKHPSFVLPLPRQVPAEDDANGTTTTATTQAVELHYLQFTHPHQHTTTLLFTTLGEFKLKGEYASPHTAVTFHAELVDSHGLVLGQGTVVEGRGVSVDEAQWLVMCMQKFYIVGEEGQGRGELLDMFTRGDSAFKVERLIEEAERIL